MTQNDAYQHIGNIVSTDICGIAITGDKTAIDSDSTDSRIAIEHCGQNVFELWFHTPEDFSIRVIVTSEWMRDVEKAMRSIRKTFGSGIFEG